VRMSAPVMQMEQGMRAAMPDQRFADQAGWP